MKLERSGYLEPVITPEAFILGDFKVPQEILCPNKDWTQWLLTPESQKKGGTDVCNCTVHAWLHSIGIYMKKKFFLTEEQANYCERATTILANINCPGTDPEHTIEVIRNNGLMMESVLPFVEGMSPEDYLSPNPLRPEHIAEMRKWLKKYYLRHDIVLQESDSQASYERVSRALQFSPVPLAVSAWMDRNGKYYRFDHDNHLTCAVKDEGNGVIQIFDSYEPYTKYLESGFGFNYAKRFYIGAQEEPNQQQDYLTYLSELIQLAFISLSESIASYFNKKATPSPSISDPLIPSVQPVPPQIDPVPVEPVSSIPTIKDWGLAIKSFEGWRQIPPSRSFKNNNPGNLRASQFVKDVLRCTGVDKDNFAQWNTYEDGFSALCKFLSYAQAQKGQGLASYDPSMTIYQFFSVYAPSSDNNSPLIYAKFVAKKCNISVNDKISIFRKVVNQ